jgi:putative ABC transport system permease protein
VGRTITLEDVLTTIVGVLPDLPVTWFGRQKEIYTVKPFEQRGIPHEQIMGGLSFMRCIGRLKPGVTLPQAQAALEPIDVIYHSHFPENPDSWRTITVHAADQIAAHLRPAFTVLFGAVSAVLLIACSNISNLLLIRFVARTREIAVRIALGADRRNVIRLFAMESLLVSLTGGAAGFCIALWLGRIIPSLAGDKLPLNGNPVFHWPTMAFAAVISVIAGLATGIYPAWQSSQTDLVSGLKTGGQSSGSSVQQRFRRALIATQIAIAIILISAASMLISSFIRLTRQDPGFRPDRVWVGGIALPISRYPHSEQRVGFLTQLLAELQTSPTVESVSAGDSVPLAGDALSIAYAVPSDGAMPVSQWPLGPMRTILPGFFRTLGIPILSGRDFAPEDKTGRPDVVIISNATAKKLFANVDPIGRELLLGSEGSKVQIVGVVGDVRSRHLSAISDIQFYTAWAQRPSASFVLVVRSATTPDTTMSVVRAALNRIDRGLPILWPSTVDAIVNHSIGQERLTVSLLGIFATVALLLAIIGVYGAVAYSVEQRTSEIGVRMALGAQSGDVLQLVLKQGMTPVVIGLVAGLTITLAAGNVVAAQLYQISPRNPILLGVSAAVLGSAALLACVIPAQRATRVNPVVALRSE